MNARSVLGSLQIPVATVGVVCLIVAVSVAASLDTSPEGEGFVTGLALLVLYFLAWVGFLLTAFGLAIPPGDGYGIRFNRYQRGLFVLAGVAGLLNAVGPFVLFGLVYSNPSLMGTAWVATMAVAVLALAAGLGWRALSAVLTWHGDRESAPASGS